MHEQYKYLYTKHGLSWEIWSTKTSPHRPPISIIVAVEQTEWEDFRTYVGVLLAGRRVARVIVDEAHLVQTHRSFRPVMETLVWLGKKNVQIVLQTTTWPPALEKALLDDFGIPVESCYIARCNSSRSNISFNVVRSETHDIDAAVKKQYLSAKDYSETNRVLIFCLTKREVQQTARDLNIPYCDASLTQGDMDSVLEKFRVGKVRQLCCSSILGVGLDVANITHVIHKGYPRDILSFVQETGRLGRDLGTRKAWSVVVLPPFSGNDVPPGRFGERLVRLALDSIEHCRRLVVQMFIDGEAHSCILMERETHLCDVCNKQSKSKPDREQSVVFPWALMRDGLGGKSPCGTWNCELTICSRGHKGDRIIPAIFTRFYPYQCTI
jgi:Helicase conserved C-terminal domain